MSQPTYQDLLLNPIYTNLSEEDKKKPTSFGSLTPVIGGLATEVAIGESAKYGGAALGSMAGPVGTAIGYVVGGIGGGAMGSIANQRINQEDISWGRVLADSLINLIPAGKVTKGASFVQDVGKAALRQGAMGTGIAAGAEVVEQGWNDGRLPTIEELGEAGLSGALVGAGFGVGGEFLGKFLGQSVREIDAKILAGDKDAIKFIDAFQASLGQKFEPTDSDILKHSLPRTTVGKKVSNLAGEAQGKVYGYEEISGRIRQKVDSFVAKSDDPIRNTNTVNDFIFGRSSVVDPSLKPIENEMYKYRSSLRELQENALRNDASGAKKLPKYMRQKIEDTLNTGDYVATSYKFFGDATYVPSKASEEKVIQELMQEGQKLDERKWIQQTVDGVKNKVQNPNFGGMRKRKALTRAQAENVLRKFSSKRSFSDDNPFITSNGLNPFKAKNKDLSPAWKEYLGEVTSPGEMMETTINRLARSTLFHESDHAIKNYLLDIGYANGKGIVPEGWVPLKLRRGVAKVMNAGEETDVYVPSSFKTAIDEVYGMKLDEETHNGVISMLNDVWSTGVAASKQVKVLGNLPSYAVNVWSSLAYQLGLGINPTHALGKAIKYTATTIDATKELAFKHLSKEGKNPYDEVQMLLENGILNNSVVTRDIMAGLKHGKLGAALAPTVKKFADIYSAPDNATRINIFYHMKDNVVKKIFPNADDVMANKLAAEITNDVYQNYDMLPPILRKFAEKGLIGQFAAFPLELARNTYNQARISYKMIRGEWAQELVSEMGGKVDVKAMRDAGMKMLASQGLMLGAATGGVTAFNQFLGGLSNDEVQAYKETVLPEWDQRKPIGITKGKDGELRYLNLAYNMPQASMAGIVKSAFSGKSLEEAVSELAKSVYQEVGGSGTFLIQNAMAAVQNLDPQTRRAISKDPNIFRSTMEKMDWFIGESFTPGQWREIQKALENPAEQTAMRHMGVRINTTTEEKGVAFRAREIGQRLRDLGSDLAGARYQGDIRKFEQIVGTQKAVFDELTKHVGNLRTLGWDDDKIIQNLSKSIPKRFVLDVMDGVFTQPPLQKEKTMGDVVDEIQSMDPAQKGEALRRLEPKVRYEVVKRIEKERQHGGWNEREKYISGLGVIDGERARYITRWLSMQPEKTKGLMELKRKGLVNDTVLQQILQLQQQP